MNLSLLAIFTASCLFQGQHFSPCVQKHLEPQPNQVATSTVPQKTGESLNVILSADAYIVWDIASGTTLLEHNSHEKRPIASLTKLAATLAIRETLPLNTTIEIPVEARRAQQLGANIKLPVGQHAQVSDLLAASLIPSANDAMVSLALAADESEEAFAQRATKFAQQHGMQDTKLANSTGLSGGDQYSTAHDVKTMLTLAYTDSYLKPLLSQDAGVLQTQEGKVLEYKTTNKLLGTYMPILAAKTGYTIEAGENLAIITRGAQGQDIGVVVLGSKDRFQDTKAVVEWVWRNYSWN